MKAFAKYFDHTVLSPTTTTEDLKRICEEAIQFGFFSVAVNTGMVKACSSFLRRSGVLVDAAVSFPLGITTLGCKLYEAEQAIQDGAAEIDYVIHIGKMKEGDTAYIRNEMEAMTALCQKYDVTSKVIIENCYLTDDEKRMLCQIARQVKPDFIKTSTGFGKGGATLEDVRLIKDCVGDSVKVKAAGGIKSLEQCLALIEAGADRIGCSASCSIITEYRNRKKG